MYGLIHRLVTLDSRALSVTRILCPHTGALTTEAGAEQQSDTSAHAVADSMDLAQVCAMKHSQLLPLRAQLLPTAHVTLQPSAQTPISA